MGGMGEECARYHARLAELLAIKKGKTYSTTVSWIWAKVLFALLRGALLCLRGSRGNRKLNGKGKGHSYLTSVVPSFLTRLLSMEDNGAPSTPCHCQCSVLRVFKPIATRIRGKLKQMLKSLKIEPGTSH